MLQQEADVGRESADQGKQDSELKAQLSEKVWGEAGGLRPSKWYFELSARTPPA